MPEMPNPGQHHDHFALVGGGNHLVIAQRRGGTPNSVRPWQGTLQRVEISQVPCVARVPIGGQRITASNQVFNPV